MARPSHLETIETASGERRAAAQGMLDVARIAREAMRDVDLEAVLQRITEQGLALGAVAAWLYRYAGAEGLLHRAASWRVPEDAVACPASLPADAPDLLALALRTCEVHVVEDLDGLAPGSPDRRWIEVVDGRSMIVVPLVFQESAFGVLAWVFDGPRQPSAHEREVYRIMGEFFGLAALHAEAHRQLVREIEERKRVERERERLLAMVEKERVWLRFMIERSPVAVVMMRPGGQVLWNAEAEALLGRSIDPHGGLEQFAGAVRLPSGRILGKDRKLGWDLATSPLFVNAEATILRADGEEIPVFGTLGYLHDDRGRLVGGVAILQDMRPIKELEKLRQEWTSVVAHDLRQPTTLIHTYASLLARSDLDDKSREKVEHILTSTRQLERMVADLLDASLLESRHLKLEKEPTDIAALCASIGEKLLAKLGDRQFSLRVEGEPFLVDVDPTRIEQLVGNLVSNAVRYGYPESPIEMRLRFVSNEREVEFCITNRGEGIAPEQMTSLFERFSRGSRARGSVGLGLYIAKGIVEAHGGRIWAESEPGERTTFFFRLPAEAESGA
ncbi:MAG TPA: ATP-binding protein [Fredinandcohnia sp.]|nr:ATP-binding protein [Fredinandcohnia sp.]